VRLFVAVELEDDAARRVSQISAQLRQRVEHRAPSARLTWIPPERMHLTVRFIGEVDERRAEAIRAQLSPPLATPVFDLRLEGTGAFPPRGPARVLWAGVTQGIDELIALEREASLRLVGCDVPLENRPYRPHLTLARVRDAKGLETAGLFDGLDEPIDTIPVRTITLFSSRLSPKGPTYLPLQSTGLTWKK